MLNSGTSLPLLVEIGHVKPVEHLPGVPRCEFITAPLAEAIRVEAKAKMGLDLVAPLDDALDPSVDREVLVDHRRHAHVGHLPFEQAHILAQEQPDDVDRILDQREAEAQLVGLAHGLLENCCWVGHSADSCPPRRPAAWCFCSDSGLRTRPPRRRPDSIPGCPPGTPPARSCRSRCRSFPRRSSRSRSRTRSITPLRRSRNSTVSSTLALSFSPRTTSILA